MVVVLQILIGKQLAGGTCAAALGAAWWRQRIERLTPDVLGELVRVS
jgi:hypothetical protein